MSRSQWNQHWDPNKGKGKPKGKAKGKGMNAAPTGPCPICRDWGIIDNSHWARDCLYWGDGTLKQPKGKGKSSVILSLIHI